jgi:hypothetical protein
MESTVTLQALRGTPLEDPQVRDMVVAMAHGIVERYGMVIRSVETEPDRVVVTIASDRLAALGLIAELRRDSNAWYERKYRDGPLWGTPPPDWEFRPDEPN